MNCARSVAKKVLFHPARLSFPFMDPFDPSSLARLRASLRSRAIFSRPAEGIVLAMAGSIFVHDDVEDPVQAILDPPAGADDVGAALCGKRQAKQIIRCFCCRFLHGSGRRRLLPSMALTPSRPAAKRSMKRRKPALNGFGSSRRNSRLNVSWLGIPCRKRRNCLRKSALAWPNSAMSEQSSPPHARPRKKRQTSRNAG